MKNLGRAGLLMAVLHLMGGTLCSLIAQTFTNPVDYNNYIVEEQGKVIAENVNYISYSVHSDDLQLIESKRIELITQLMKSIRRIESLPPYENNAKLRDEAVAVLEVYLDAFKVDLGDIAILKRDSESSYEAMEAYFSTLAQAEVKLNQASDRFDLAQKRFAKSYNINMVETDETFTESLAQISAVNAYTRDMYLVYFKVSRKNAVLIDALETNDPKKVDNARKGLLQTSIIANRQAKVIGDYRGDGGYLDATLNWITYLENMAEEDFIRIVEFLDLSKKKDNLTTKEEVDQYNTLVDTYNQTIQSYNTNSQALNESFNQAYRLLLQKHIPDLTKKLPKGNRI